MLATTCGSHAYGGFAGSGLGCPCAWHAASCDRSVSASATAADQLPAEVPFGLQIAPGAQTLEENPAERETLVQLMELIVQEGSYSRIADELNRRGFRTRQGARWTPVSVFEMLPRMIEVGPQIFQSSEWQKRKRHITEGALSGVLR